MRNIRIEAKYSKKNGKQPFFRAINYLQNDKGMIYLICIALYKFNQLGGSDSMEMKMDKEYIWVIVTRV